jgi:non-specific protein-tyrosine kinase
VTEESHGLKPGLLPLIALVRERLWLVPLCAVLAASAAVLANDLPEDRYRASAGLLFRQTNLDSSVAGAPFFSPQSDPVRQGSTNLELVTLPLIAEQVKTKLELSEPADELLDRIEAEQEGDSDVVTVSTEHPDPRRAQQIVNTWAGEVVAFRRATDRERVSEAILLVQDELEAVPADSAQADSLRERREELQILQSLQTGGVELLQPAVVPSAPVGFSTVRVAIAALLAGAMLGTGLALVAGRLDRRLKHTDDAGRILGLPVLSTVPQISSRQASFRPHTDPGLVEASRTLAVRLSFFHVDRRISDVVVTSAIAGEGKTTVAVGLARALAADGGRTLLVECDLRAGSIAGLLGLLPRGGLAEVLANKATFEDVVQHVPGGEWTGPIDVLPAGYPPPNPVQMLASERMATLVAAIRNDYDHVVFDTPPILAVSDALTLMRHADGFVFVTRIRHTEVDALRRSRDILAPSIDEALGLVVNGLPAKDSGYGYGYGYGPSAPREPEETLDPIKPTAQ